MSIKKLSDFAQSTSGSEIQREFLPTTNALLQMAIPDIPLMKYRMPMMAKLGLKAITMVDTACSKTDTINIFFRPILKMNKAYILYFSLRIPSISKLDVIFYPVENAVIIRLQNEKQMTRLS